MRSTTSRTRPLEQDNFLLEKRARVYRCNQCDAHTSEMINLRRQTDLVTELPCFGMTYLVRTYDTINFDRIRSDGGQKSGERLTLKVPRRSGQNPLVSSCTTQPIKMRAKRRLLQLHHAYTHWALSATGHSANENLRLAKAGWPACMSPEQYLKTHFLSFLRASKESRTASVLKIIFYFPPSRNASS